MRIQPLRRRKSRRPATLLATALTLTLVPSVTGPLTTKAQADTVDRPKVTQSADGLTLSVPGTRNTPGYAVDIATDELALTTERSGKTVLGTAGGDTGGLRFRSDEKWEHATEVTDWTWQSGVLTLTTDTTLDGATVKARITPEADRYQLDWDVEGGSPDQLGLAYDLSSAGHWYGHGEAETPQGGPGVNQPWPLDSRRGRPRDLRPGLVQHDRPVLVHLQVDRSPCRHRRRHGRGAQQGQGRPRHLHRRVARHLQGHRVRRVDPARGLPRLHRHRRQADQERRHVRAVRQAAVEFLGAVLHEDRPGETARLRHRPPRERPGRAHHPARRQVGVELRQPDLGSQDLPRSQGSLPEDPRHGLRLRYLGHPVDQPGLRQLPVRGRQRLPAHGRQGHDQAV